MAENLCHLMLWVIILGTLTLAQIGIPEARSNRTNCFSNILGDTMSPFCNSNSKIAIESLKYTCLRTPNCSDNAAASMAVSSGILQNAVTQVSGLRQYPYRVNQQLCTTSHTFMFMRITYYCIAESRTLEMCTANSISSRGVIYIMSNNYAYDHSVTATNCNCSVSVSNNASYSTHAPSTNITMVTVHTELGTGQQLSLMSLQGVFLRNFTLQTSQYAVSSEQLPYSELDLIWRSRKTGSTGRFWVGFQSSDPNFTVTVSCKKPVDILNTSAVTSTSTIFSSSSLITTSGHSIPSITNRNNSIRSSSIVTSPHYHLNVATTRNKSQPRASTQPSSVNQASKSDKSNISGILLPTSSHSLTIRSKTLDSTKPTKDNGIVPIIGGVIGGIFLLLIIILIICLIKKKKSNKAKVEPEKHQASVEEPPQEINGSSKLPPLPPIIVPSSGGQSANIPDQLFDDDYHGRDSSALVNDMAVEEKDGKKSNEQKKKQEHWRVRAADEEDQSSDNPDHDSSNNNIYIQSAIVNDKVPEDVENENKNVNKKKKKKKRRHRDRVADPEDQSTDMPGKHFADDDKNSSVMVN